MLYLNGQVFSSSRSNQAGFLISLQETLDMYSTTLDTEQQQLFIQYPESDIFQSNFWNAFLPKWRITVHFLAGGILNISKTETGSQVPLLQYHNTDIMQFGLSEVLRAPLSEEYSEARVNVHKSILGELPMDLDSVLRVLQDILYKTNYDWHILVNRNKLWVSCIYRTFLTHGGVFGDALPFKRVKITLSNDPAHGLQLLVYTRVHGQPRVLSGTYAVDGTREEIAHHITQIMTKVSNFLHAPAYRIGSEYIQCVGLLNRRIEHLESQFQDRDQHDPRQQRLGNNGEGEEHAL